MTNNKADVLENLEYAMAKLREYQQGYIAERGDLALRIENNLQKLYKLAVGIEILKFVLEKYTTDEEIELWSRLTITDIMETVQENDFVTAWYTDGDDFGYNRVLEYIKENFE